MHSIFRLYKIFTLLSAPLVQEDNCEIWGSQNSVDEDPSFPEYGAMEIVRQLLTPWTLKA